MELYQKVGFCTDLNEHLLFPRQREKTIKKLSQILYTSDLEANNR